jgi:hypothetical protein
MAKLLLVEGPVTGATGIGENGFESAFNKL